MLAPPPAPPLHPLIHLCYYYLLLYLTRLVFIAGQLLIVINSHVHVLYCSGVFLRVIDLINRQQLILTQSNDSVLLVRYWVIIDPTVRSLLLFFQVLNFLYFIINQVKQYGLLLEATVLLLGSLLRLHLSSTTSSFQVINKLLKLLLQTCRGHMDELPW